MVLKQQQKNKEVDDDEDEIQQQQQQQQYQVQYQLQLGSNRPQSSIGRRLKKERENSIVDNKNNQKEKFYSLVQEDQSLENYYQKNKRVNMFRPPSQAGMRRKDYTLSNNTNQEFLFGSILQNDSQYNIDYSKRPLSRQKTPQKALELELQDDGDSLLQEIPVKNMFQQEIPIKQMYEESNNKNANQYENSFINNQFDQLEQQELDFSKIDDSSQDIHFDKNSNNDSVQSVDIQNTYKIIDKQMEENFQKKLLPNNFHQHNQTITTKLDGSNIIIKHVIKNNNTINLSKNQQVNISIPFETSLGNDFLSLFANTKEQKINN